MPYTVSSSEGTHFGVMYDDKFVYLGIQVNDSEVMATSSQTTFNQDFVGFVIDGQPFAKSATDEGEAWFNNSLYFIASPADESGKNSVWDMNDAEKELTWKCIKNEKGYAFELAVPISYIEKQQGSNWRTARINVVVQDRDSDNMQSKRVTWQPNWRDASNLIGSGMFFRR